MDSTGASVSLNGSCTTAAAAVDSATVVPHYLRPFTGSCHDICKYGHRRAPEEQPTKPLHKTSAKLSIVVPSHQRKEALKGQPLSPSGAKSFSPRAKNHSPRQNTLSDAPQVFKRGIAKESSNSAGSKMSKQKGRQLKKSAVVKQSSPRDSSDGVSGKRRRNEDVQNGGNSQSSMLSGKKTWMPVVGAPLYAAKSEGGKTANVELVSPRMDRKRVKRVKTDSPNALPPSPSIQEDDREIKIPRTKTEGNEFEFKFEAVADGPSSPSQGEEDEESDKLASDTTVSQRKRNRNKRRRKSRVVKAGDKHNPPVKLKFRAGNTTHPHDEGNAPRRRKLKATQVDRVRSDDSVSDNSKSRRIGPLKPSRTKDRTRSSKNWRRRVRYGKTRILVLEDRKGDSKRSHEEDDVGIGSLLLWKNNLNHQNVQRKKDVQCLFNNVIEETASKLAERRKGMVKSLVGAFETLISLQARKCILQLRKMNNG